MPSVSYILATAGHVDHGKSALIHALTGTDPDRLPEEKARQVTIELGFAHLELPSPPEVKPPVSYQVGVVDVPGHEDFIRNMVAGTGSIDLALLVVAADDGWMPQTEEHLQILTYLGVARGVVALTKSDLAASETHTITAIRERLRNSPLADAPIIPTSIVTGIGLNNLKMALAQALSHTSPPRDINKPRLPIDRVFTLKGVGTVVTGTLTGGTLHQRQSIIVQPAGFATRIRTLQTHNHEVASARPGSRVALNLPNLQPTAHAAPAAGIGRGDVVTLPAHGEPCDTLDVLLWRTARVPGEKPALPRPLKHNLGVLVHHGSAASHARVHLIDAKQLEPGGQALAQLRFNAPIFTAAGDRFVIRDASQRHTLAGGIILDPQTTRRGLRESHRRAFLRQRAHAPDDVFVHVCSQLTRDGMIRRQALLLQSNFAESEIDRAVEALASEGRIVIRDDLLIDPAWWDDLHRLAVGAIDDQHAEHPEQLGLGLAPLRHLLEKTSASPAATDALLADLCRDGFVRTTTTIRRSDHRPALPPGLQSAGDKLRTLLASHPFNPPSRRQLAPDPRTQQALKFLVINGEAVELSPEIILSTDAFEQAIQTVRCHIHNHGPATVSELKTALHSSRRIMIPLLENLDREGITRRQDDQRVLR